jgi:glycogen synthase
MEDINPKVLMVSTECRELAKVSGLADVVRDLSKALRSLGTTVSIVMPCYERIHHPAEPIVTIN